jgi:hypothetical protein
MSSKESEMFVVIIVAAILCIALSFGFGYYKGLSDAQYRITEYLGD